MKLQDLKLDGWDSTFEEVCFENNEKILLLHLSDLSGLREEGRRNLIKVDNSNSIIWIAEAPKIGRSIGWYTRFRKEGEKYIVWYTGDVLVEIDPLTGKVIKEQFIR